MTDQSIYAERDRLIQRNEQLVDEVAELRTQLSEARRGGAFHLGKGLVAVGTGTTSDGARCVWLRVVKQPGPVGADCTVENHEDVGCDLVIHNAAGARVLVDELLSVAAAIDAERA